MTLNEIDQTSRNSLSGDDSLPEGWVSASLGEGLVVDVQPGFACGENNRDGRGIAHLRPMNVHEDGRIDFSTVKFVPVSKANQEKRLLREGDVIFNNTNSSELVGKTAFYPLPEKKAFSNHMTRLRCQTEILDPQFCAMALHQKWREGYFRTVCSHHVSQSSVARAVLLDTRIVLPPLAEQKRIVAKVEELLARVNVVRERLARVKEILKRFRQSVLSAACSGRLTEDWREKNPNVEPASVLLEQIRKHYAKLKKKDKLKTERPTLNYTELRELPTKWERVLVGEISDRIHYGYTAKATYEQTGTKLLRISDIQKDMVNWEAVPYCKIGDKEKRKYLLRDGDLVFARTGATVGKSYLVRGKIPAAVFASYLIRIMINERISKEFIKIFFKSSSYLRQITSGQIGIGQPNVNAQILSQIVLPLPTSAEQNEIVRRVEALFNLADEIERRVVAATERAEKIIQAILCKAFRGELVPTEAELARREGRSYEPACQLLEKIRRQSRKR